MATTSPETKETRTSLRKFKMTTPPLGQVCRIDYIKTRVYKFKIFNKKAPTFVGASFTQELKISRQAFLC